MITIVKKPDFPVLTQLGLRCVDMHYHTTYSDGFADIKDIAEKAKKLGIGIAITDHNKIDGVLEAEKYPELFLVPGIEVDCIEGPDLLFYFYTVGELKRFYKNEIKGCRERDFSGNPKIHLKDIIEKSRDYTCIVAVPHSCHVLWKNAKAFLKSPKRKHLLDDIDAIETYNGESTMKQNIKAVHWNRELKKPIVGGSDGHCLFEFGTVVTCTQADTLKDFLDNLLGKKTFTIGKAVSPLGVIIPGTVAFVKNLNIAMLIFLLKKKGW